jgi:hypothetical protein
MGAAVEVKEAADRPVDSLEAFQGSLEVEALGRALEVEAIGVASMALAASFSLSAFCLAEMDLIRALAPPVAPTLMPETPSFSSSVRIRC